MESSRQSFLSAFCQTSQTAPLLNSLLKDTNTVTENTLQYLDVLLTVNSLTGDKCTDTVKAYLKGKNQNDADTFALVAIAAVASNSDDTWLWYTIPSWYKQIVPGTATVPTSLNLGSVYTGSGTQQDFFFNAYEAGITSTTFSGNAATLKKHLAWGWWHKPVSEYPGSDKKSDWAFTYMPSNRQGQMIGNMGYTFFGQVE